MYSHKSKPTAAAVRRRCNIIIEAAESGMTMGEARDDPKMVRGFENCRTFARGILARFK